MNCFECERPECINCKDKKKAYNEANKDKQKAYMKAYNEANKKYYTCKICKLDYSLKEIKEGICYLCLEGKNEI